VFSGVFIAEEADGVGDKGSGDNTTVDVQILLEALLDTSWRSACFIDKDCFGKKQTFPDNLTSY
jgi:hypothetical protein